MASTKLIQIQPYAYRLHHQLFYFLFQQALAIARAGGRGATTVPTPGRASSHRSWIKCCTTLCAVLGWIFSSTARLRTEGNGCPGASSPLMKDFLAA